MAGKSKISPKNLALAIEMREAGETVRAIAKRIKVSAATVQTITTQPKHIKAVAEQIVATNQALSALSIAEQVAVQNYAQKLLAITSNLTDASVASSKTAKRVAEVAHRRAEEATDEELLDEGVLKTQMQTAQVVQAHAKPGMDLLTLATKPQPAAPPSTINIIRIELVAP